MKNKQTLMWIYNRCKTFVPHILLISVFSAVISLGFVVLAMLSKTVLEVATGEKTGSFLNLSLLIAGVIIVQVILSGVDSVLKTSVSGKLTIRIREYLFSLINRKKYEEIAKYHSGDLLNRFTSDTQTVVSSAVGIIPNIVSMVAKILGGVVALISLEPKITVIFLTLAILVPLMGRLLNKKYKSLHKHCQETEGVSRSFLQECFENRIVIKTFTSEVPFLKKLDTYLKENYIFKIKRIVLTLTANLGLYSLFTIGYYAILVWGASQISAEKISYGTLLAFLQLVSQLRAPLQNISGIMPQYYSALASAERLIEFEKLSDDIPLAQDSQLDQISKDFAFIEGENIFFDYGQSKVLQAFDFKVEKGSITAVVGNSGSGKSTLFKLILGLFEAQKGDITINGNIKLDSSLRGLFAYVPQGNMVLSGSIKENIALFNPKISDKEIIKAAKMAEIHDYISALPMGYDTLLSEHGGGLSEGQVQRIAIARALLTNAPILLLDEATSALDEQTESKILEHLKNNPSRTVILATHRSTSLRVCDNIIKIDKI